MLRNTLSIVAGLVVSFVVIMIGEGLAHHLLSIPSTVKMNEPETVKTFISTAPISFHLTILFIYALASFIGAFIASIISIDKKMAKAMTVGGILMGLGIFNLISLSHPVWAIACGFIAFLPFAFGGGLFGITVTSPKG